MSELDEHEVVWDRYRDNDLAGLTLAKARIINDVLHGFPVVVYGTRDTEEPCPLGASPRERQVWEIEHRGDPTPDFGIFLGMRLPGSWGTVFDQPFDMQIATARSRDTTRIHSGTSRVLGIGALRRLEVVAMDPWGFCDVCCAWRPREYLAPRDPNAHEWADPEDLESGYYDELVCRVECGY